MGASIFFIHFSLQSFTQKQETYILSAYQMARWPIIANAAAAIDHTIFRVFEAITEDIQLRGTYREAVELARSTSLRKARHFVIVASEISKSERRASSLAIWRRIEPI